KKLVLSLVTISFLSSYSYATNTNVNSHETNTKNISNSNNIVTITNSGSVKVSNNNHKAVNFQSGSSTTTFLNQGTLIGGSNAASVQLGANRNNGVT
ncbi:autotransporter, partial [Campylobacter jejuni]|nr:autotransporter [Campylobacter jejuni]